MNIRIRYMSPKANDKELLLPVAKTTTVDQIKDLIEFAWGFSSQRLKLYYQGKVLFGVSRVYDYNIKLNDVIQLVVLPQEDTSSQYAPSIAISAEGHSKPTLRDLINSIRETTPSPSPAISAVPSTSSAVVDVIPSTITKSEPASSSDTEDDEKDEMCDDCRFDDLTCNTCGCRVCGLKLHPKKIIMCDDCNVGYHIWCLIPPLKSVPPDPQRWYCPACETNVHEIVKDGEPPKVPRRKSKKRAAVNNNKGWGKGMACVGKTEVCTIVPMDHFGPIPNVEVGILWKFRFQVAEAGVHRPIVAGIHGRESDGAFSLVLSGGYADDEDSGDQIIYTGSGGRDYSGNKRQASQSSDQRLTRMNKALAMNCNAEFNAVNGATADNWQEGKPVRVVRNYKLAKFSKYAPLEGNRYDGIYKVIKYYKEMGKAGFNVWKYVLARDDPTPAPWTDGAPTFPMIYPPGYVEVLKQDKTHPPAKRQKRSLPKVRSSLRLQTSIELERAESQRVSDIQMGDNGQIETPKTTKKQVAKKRKARKYRPKNYVWPNISILKTTVHEPRPLSPSSKALDLIDRPYSSTNKRTIITHYVSKKLTPEQLRNRRASTCSDGSNKSEQFATITYKIHTPLTDYMYKDWKNRRRWHCCNLSLYKGRQFYLNKINNFFKCAFCHDLVCKPVTTRCKHNHCFQCIRKAFVNGYYKCPVCRNDQGSEFKIIPNFRLSYILEHFFPGYTKGRF